MMPHPLALHAPPPQTHLVYCDGGLCNRLNALIYALVLRDRYGHAWSVAWPVNNWCGASFGSLFSTDMPVGSHSLQHFAALQADYLFLVHELQSGLRAEQVVHNGTLTSVEAFGPHLNGGRPVFYYHNLFPHPVDTTSIKRALSHLRIDRVVWDRAAGFCRANGIDRDVCGLHIRKTDFGATVDDARLFNSVAVHPGRFFVCSDDAGVNARFGTLANCCVLKKNDDRRRRAPLPIQHHAAGGVGGRSARRLVDPVSHHAAVDFDVDVPRHGPHFPGRELLPGLAVPRHYVQHLPNQQTGIRPRRGQPLPASARTRSH
jgi:hypothetical protein